MIISLFVETQKSVILNGQEKLDVKAFERVFKGNFGNMIPYLNLSPVEKSTKRTVTTPKLETTAAITTDSLFSDVSKLANKNITTAIAMLKEKVNVEFIEA